jgi:hypothetical protein
MGDKVSLCKAWPSPRFTPFHRNHGAVITRINLHGNHLKNYFDDKDPSNFVYEITDAEVEKNPTSVGHAIALVGASAQCPNRSRSAGGDSARPLLRPCLDLQVLMTDQARQQPGFGIFSGHVRTHACAWPMRAVLTGYDNTRQAFWIKNSW